MSNKSYLKIPPLIGAVLFMLMLVLVVGIFVLVIPLFPFLLLIHRYLKKKRLTKWNEKYEGTSFIIYPVGNEKAKYFEEFVLNELPDYVEEVSCYGNYYKGFLDNNKLSELYYAGGKGLPVIGKVKDGRLDVKYLKSEYDHMVKTMNDPSRFSKRLLDGLDKL